mmetsp:Transcript_10568/g.30506  ORF Transcript_10568/g.30506 Transcript_10568/m.30506 type:complete len:205 (-) Transcript_10568:786-1400(-)
MDGWMDGARRSLFVSVPLLPPVGVGIAATETHLHRGSTRHGQLARRQCGPLPPTSLLVCDVLIERVSCRLFLLLYLHLSPHEPVAAADHHLVLGKYYRVLLPAPFWFGYVEYGALKVVALPVVVDRHLALIVDCDGHPLHRVVAALGTEPAIRVPCELITCPANESPELDVSDDIAVDGEDVQPHLQQHVLHRVVGRHARHAHS